MLQILLLATCHTQTRNIDANFSRWMLHGRRLATLSTLFRNIVKVFRNIARAPPPDRRLIEAFIQILRRSTRPTLAPGSDVRALAVPYKKLNVRLAYRFTAFSHELWKNIR
jgi:hypothetical protein